MDIKHSQYSLDNINLKEMTILIPKLIKQKRKTFCDKEKVIIISDFTNTGKNYPLQIKIGFPFPIYETIHPILSYPAKVTYFHHGQKIRKFQLNNWLESVSTVDFNRNIIYLSNKEFQFISNRFIHDSNRELLFEEPYRYIGDGVIILKILDKIRKYKSGKMLVKAFSTNENLRGCAFFEHQQLEEYIISSKSDKILIVRPDFIDDQFDRTINLIEFLSKTTKNVVSIIMGRNIIFQKIEGEVSIFICKSDQIFLFEDSKEIMINKSLAHLGIVEKIKKEFSVKPNLKKILINVFTSNKNKNLTQSFVKDINSSFEESKFLLLKGSNNDNYELPTHHTIEVNTIQNSIDVINKKNIVITADTGIAHIANRLGKIVFVIYNNNLLNYHSFIELIHKSFMGFASFDHNFFPLIFPFNQYSVHQHLIEQIQSILLAFESMKFNDDIIKAAKEYSEITPKLDTSLSNYAFYKFLIENYDYPCLNNNLFYKYVDKSFIFKNMKNGLETQFRLSPSYKLAMIFLSKAKIK